MTDATSTVILIGASVRAAADSAARAGWTPWCADLFADRDLCLRANARAVPSEEYPRGFLNLLAEAPNAPVIYTGALENYPGVIGRIDRPVWGQPHEVLRAVRDPQRWTTAVAAVGLSVPAMSDDAQAGGRWLLKPRCSGAGHGVVPYRRQPFDSRTHFLQQWIDGPVVSALCLGNGEGANVVGVSEQLVGLPWLHAGGFHYAGNIGPLPIADRERAHWARLADVLARAFHLRGLFGIDAIVRDGLPWPIEINPRYTAAVEIHERAMGLALLPWHRRAFDGSPPAAWTPPSVARCHGKAVMYARETFRFPHEGPWLESLAAGANVDAIGFADIPHAGTTIRAGHPVLTFFADATSPKECAVRLQEIAVTLARSLWC